MDRRLTPDEATRCFEAAAYSTAQPNRHRTEKAIAALYEGAGLDAPTVVWGRSPREACRAADPVAGKITCSTLPGDRLLVGRAPREVEDEVSHVLLPWLSPEDEWVPNLGSEIAYPEALWRVIGFGHGLRDHPAHIGSFRYWEETSDREQWAMIRFVESVGWWRLHRTHAFVSERPTSIVLDHRNRPHSTVAPAVTFRDGWKLYAVDGLRVPSWTVTEPDRLTPEDIDEVRNAELRRVLVTLAGDRYIEDRGSLVHIDKWGELWEVPDVEGRFLRVTDATPLPDGTSKRYWLRVPRTHKTAHGAVAWTFGLTKDKYRPQVQT